MSAFRLSLILLSGGLLVLAVVGQFRYTSIGVDLEREGNEAVHCSYYRVRWPGNGGLWFGGGTHDRRLHAQPVQPFDLACSAFHPVSRVPKPISVWNRLGFWWMVDPATDPSNPGPRPQLRSGFWVGIPAWLPPILLMAVLWRGWFNRGPIARIDRRSEPEPVRDSD